MHLRTYLCAMTVVVAAAAADTPAAVVYTSQERTIGVTANQTNDGDRSTEAGPFQGSAEASEDLPELRSRASITQDSTLDDQGIRLSGVYILEQELRDEQILGDPDNYTGVDARYGADITFTLDAPARYRWTRGRLAGAEERNDNTVDSGYQYILDGENDRVFEDASDVSPQFPFEGVLEAGTYHFTAMFLAVNNPGGGVQNTDFRSSYDVALSLSDVSAGGGNGGGTPNPIPLPPAVWSGLATMGGGALVGWLRRRRSA